MEVEEDSITRLPILFRRASLSRRQFPVCEASEFQKFQVRGCENIEGEEWEERIPRNRNTHVETWVFRILII